MTADQRDTLQPEEVGLADHSQAMTERSTPQEASMSLFEVERKLRALENSSGKVLLELRKLRLVSAEKRDALRKAKAAARKRAPKGAAAERTAFVEGEVVVEQHAAELADIEVRYGADLVDERISVRSSLQSRAKVVTEAMRLAGYSGGA